MATRVSGTRPVWLVGMMGAGKSSLGPRLAASLGREFFDSDEEIERRAGRSVAEIFAKEGEQAFRCRERECIEALADRGAVVALGGGAIAQPGAAERLAKLGWVVYLRASPEQLLRRLGRGEGRPLLQGLDEASLLARLTELLAGRRAAYETAAVSVDSGDDAGSEELIAELAQRVAELERRLDASCDVGKSQGSGRKGR